MTTEQTSIVVYGAAELRTRVDNLRAAVMKEGIDYGTIPGSDKKVLKKPGAEKLCSEFGFYPRFEQVTAIEEFSDRPLFHYRYRAILYRMTGEPIAEGIGSCNSMEKKYRYRQGERLCPTCGKPTIIKGKAEYGGGWVCFAKKGGCGAKFADTDPQIADQQVGQVENTDIYDQINTIDKMAQKRALVAAVLIATNASDYFTQDLDDFADVVDGSFQEVPQTPKSSQNSPSKQSGGTKGKSTPKPPEQAADAEIWPSDTSVGELLKRITAKDGLAPNAPLPDIARWAGIDDVLNIEAWAKYPTRAVAGYAIKVAYEQEWKKSDSEWRANMEEPIHDVPF